MDLSLQPVKEVYLIMNKIITHILLITMFLSTPAFAQQNENEPEELKVEYANGIVLEVLSEFENESLAKTLGSEQKVQYLQVKVTSGTQKGKIINVLNQRMSSPIYDIDAAKGDKVVLDIETQGDVIDAYIADKQRVPVLLISIGLFFTALLLVGGKKGLSSLFSILVTAVMIFAILIPLTLKGMPVIPLTIFVSIISTLVTMFVVGGCNRKSVSATIGTILSLVIAGFLSMFVIKYGYITGFTDQTSIILFNSRPDLDFKGLITAAMIIAALGAIMDVGMSISSCIYEIKDKNPSLNRKELAISGMNVGKDIIGTMSNTLILAYLGAAFHLMLLSTDVPLIKFLNLNSVTTEISAALIGSIGIVMCVPITAFIAAYLCKDKVNKS